MCRICGRIVKCIFDTMPSRTIARPNPQILVAQSRQLLSIHRSRHASSLNRPGKIPTLSRAHSHLHSQPLAIRTRSFQHTAHNRVEAQSTEETIEPFVPQSSAQTQASSLPQTISNQTATLSQPSAPAKLQQPLVLSKSVQTLLPVLAAQTPHYITMHIHSFPYLLTEGDTLRLPFHLHGVFPGDILRFNRATILGSRDYTLKAAALPTQLAQNTAPDASARKLGEVKHMRGELFTNRKRTGEPSYIDERLFECRVRVMSLDSGPMVVTEKKKRRIRRLKKVMSKHKYTVVKVMEVKVKTLEELLEQEQGQVVME